MARHANAMLTVVTHSVTVVSLLQRKMKTKYLRGCSHECRVHPRNRYVSENGLSQEEVVSRLAAIGESLDVTPA